MKYASILPALRFASSCSCASFEFASVRGVATSDAFERPISPCATSALVAGRRTLESTASTAGVARQMFEPRWCGESIIGAASLRALDLVERGPGC